MIELPVLRGKELIAPFYNLWKDKARFAGGFVRWMVSPHYEPAPAGDIDIYPNSEQDRVDIIHDMVRVFGNMKPSFQSPVASSYDLVGAWEKFPKLQIMSTQDEGNFVVEGPLEVLINSFDFTVIMAGLLSLDKALVHDDFLTHEMRKWLIINNIHCPISAVKRIAKYTKKGYYINPLQIFKLFEDWDNRDPDYKHDLEGMLRQAYDRNGLSNGAIDFDNLEEISNVTSSSGSARKSLFKLLYVD